MRSACYGITADLITLGKVIGGGMPLGAFGGRRDIMAKIAPLGPVYQAGTLSGNPVAVAAGIATLSSLQAPGFYAELERATRALTDGLNAAAQRAGHRVFARRPSAACSASIFARSRRAATPK